MKKQEELEKQQVDENKEKLMYITPTLIVYGTMDIHGGLPGISETICGCAAAS